MTDWHHGFGGLIDPLGISTGMSKACDGFPVWEWSCMGPGLYAWHTSASV